MSPRVYQLHSTFTFGKYKGDTIEDVLEDNYEYIIWCLDNLDWFKVSEEVYEKLTELQDKYYESNREEFYLRYGDEERPL